MSPVFEHVLLVDDDPADNFLHHKRIVSSGVSRRVTVRETGMEALAYLSEAKPAKGEWPDLILLDVNMPGVNGWEFLSEFTNMPKGDDRPDPRIVILTTSDNPEDRRLAQSSPLVCDFMEKPLNAGMLRRLLRRE